MRKSKILRSFYLLSLIVIGALIVHLITILSSRDYVRNSLWNKLEAQSSMLNWSRLPLDNNIMVNQDPLFETLICHFNTKDNAVLLSAFGSSAFWSLTVFNEDTKPIFSISQTVTNNSGFTILIGSPLQLSKFDQNYKARKLTKLILKDQNAFAILKIAHFNPSWDNLVERFIKNAKCDMVIE